MSNSVLHELFFQGPELLSKYVGESERAVREVSSLNLPYSALQKYSHPFIMFQPKTSIYFLGILCSIQFKSGFDIYVAQFHNKCHLKELCKKKK